MSDVEIWHNPKCTKSVAAVEFLRAEGIRPRVVLYLEKPPTTARLDEVLTLLGLEPRQLMRHAEPIYKELALKTKELDRAGLLGVMVENPVLIERPIVIVGKKAVIARPPERSLEVL